MKYGCFQQNDKKNSYSIYTNDTWIYYGTGLIEKITQRVKGNNISQSAHVY